jgi:hypothetical protein
MALTTKQLETFANIEGLPVKQLWCIAKAAYKLYKCIKAAGGNATKIVECVGTFVTDIESCFKKPSK